MVFFIPSFIPADTYLLSLRPHRDSSVQHFGCWALANVGWGQANVQKFAREEGAMEAIQVSTPRDRFFTVLNLSAISTCVSSLPGHGRYVPSTLKRSVFIRKLVDPCTAGAGGRSESCAIYAAGRFRREWAISAQKLQLISKSRRRFNIVVWLLSGSRRTMSDYSFRRVPQLRCRQRCAVHA